MESVNNKDQLHINVCEFNLLYLRARSSTCKASSHHKIKAQCSHIWLVGNSIHLFKKYRFVCVLWENSQDFPSLVPVGHHIAIFPLSHPISVSCTSTLASLSCIPGGCKSRAFLTVNKIDHVAPTVKVIDAFQASVEHSVVSLTASHNHFLLEHILHEAHCGKIHLSPVSPSKASPVFPMDPVVLTSSSQSPQNCLPLLSFMLLKGLRRVDEEYEVTRGKSSLPLQVWE